MSIRVSALHAYLGGNAKKEIALDYLYSIEERQYVRQTKRLYRHRDTRDSREGDDRPVGYSGRDTSSAQKGSGICQSHM